MERLPLLVFLTAQILCSAEGLLILSGGGSSLLSHHQELLLNDGPQQGGGSSSGGSGIVVPGRRQCPLFCECDTWLELARASCTGHELHSVHVGVPYVVQALDLSNNSVDRLEDKQLSRAGLTRLKYLNLSINAINEIGPNAFDDLKNLTVLDLSMNRLDYIDPDTFYDNENLRILRLAGSKFNMHVPQLRSASLKELDFSSCRINKLLPQTFEGLKNLRKLDLSNNDLVFLDKDVLLAMPFLQDLSLSRNHFMCNPRTMDLNLYLRTANIRTELICERPSSSGGGAISLDRLIAMKTMSDAEPTGRPSQPQLPGDADPSGYTVSQSRWHLPWHNREQQFRPPEELFHRQPDESDVDDADEGDDSFRVSGNTSTGFAGSGVSPFWFLVTGFLLGSGATMILTYLWLSTTISCLIPRIRRVEAADSTDAGSSQRVSLLRNLWQQDSMGSTEDNNASGTSGSTSAPTVSQMFLPSGATVTPSCPGTPPPPYREVMLHRNLYPRAAMAAAAQQHQHQVSARWLVPIGGGGSSTTNPSTAYNI